MNIDHITSEALNRYFDRLHQVGYMSYNDVNLLLILTYIQDIYDNYSLTDEELRILDRAMNCIQGKNCMIPYSTFNGSCNH